MKRRDAIKALFAAATLGVSGCVESIEEDPENPNNDTTPNNNGGGGNHINDGNGGNGDNNGNTTENNTNETDPIEQLPDTGVVVYGYCTTIQGAGSRDEIIYSVTMENRDDVTHEGVELDVWFRDNGAWRAGDNSPDNFDLEPGEVQTREIGYTSFDSSTVDRVKHQISVLEGGKGHSARSDILDDC